MKKEKKSSDSPATQRRKADMLKALEQTLGIVTLACKLANIDRKTHYYWMDNDEDYRRSVFELKDLSLDFAESALHKQIRENNVTAIIFYLKTQGKNRGYVERIENGVYALGDIKVQFE